MKVNNITVQAPIAQNFKIDPVEHGVSRRTASGRSVKDVTAIKNNFYLTYKGLKYNDYKAFYDAFIAGNPVQFEYLDNDIPKEKTVYVTSVPRGIYQEKSTISHNINITLEEV